MEGHYDITIDRQRGLLRIVLGGFFSLDDVARYSAAKNAALQKLGCGRNQHLTLCDVSACVLQSQEIVAAFQKMTDDPRYRSRRLAFVSGSSLSRMQIRRILTRDAAACFSNVAEAEAWLFEQEAVVRAGG